MNNEIIDYVGNYRPAAGSRAHDMAFWSSDVIFNNQERRIVDAAGMGADGRNVVKLIPYGPNSRDADTLLENGDLMAYIRGRHVVRIGASVDGLLPILKGRASHAELGYRSATGKSCHVSLWDATNPIHPTDCKVFSDQADNAALGIYRVSLREYGIDSSMEAKLKAEVRRWKEIVRPVYFPNGDAMNFDPVDFASIEALGEIARKYLRHVPADPIPPVDFRFNCVQWSTLVLSLALCYPLTRKTLMALRSCDEFDTHWKSRVGGYCEDGVEGLRELPVPFYTPMEVIENALDLYLPDMKDVVLELAKKYPVEALLHSKGLTFDQRVIMPSAFIIENRLRSLGIKRKTKTVFEYVATALPEGELEVC